MNMIEKVARAISEQDYNANPDTESNLTKDIYINRFWKMSIPHAVAAIEAMREPSSEMKKLCGEAMQLNYQAMIDKALEQ